MERKFLIKGKWYIAHNKKEWIKLAHSFARQIEPNRYFSTLDLTKIKNQGDMFNKKYTESICGYTSLYNSFLFLFKDNNILYECFKKLGVHTNLYEISKLANEKLTELYHRNYLLTPMFTTNINKEWLKKLLTETLKNNDLSNVIGFKFKGNLQGHCISTYNFKNGYLYYIDNNEYVEQLLTDFVICITALVIYDNKQLTDNKLTIAIKEWFNKNEDFKNEQDFVNYLTYLKQFICDKSNTDRRISTVKLNLVLDYTEELQVITFSYWNYTKENFNKENYDKYFSVPYSVKMLTFLSKVNKPTNTVFM